MRHRKPDDYLRRLVEGLVSADPSLHLWVAGVYDSDDVPTSLARLLLDTPLRAAPRLVREVAPAIVQSNQVKRGQVPAYNMQGAHEPADGPAVLVVRHHGAGHTTQGSTEIRKADGSVTRVSLQHLPWHCRQCGTDAAQRLQGRLNVGAQGERHTCKAGMWVVRRGGGG